MNESKDWQKWHTLYNDDGSGLAKRLKLVQESIGSSLPETLKGKYQIIDICSGDGRDLLEVLAHHPSSGNVHSYLVEIDSRLAQESERTASDRGLRNVTVVNGDASSLRIYKNVIPADLILLCGIFGNISNEDIRNIIESLAQLSKRGTRVIWTRNLRNPDVVPIIRDSFITNNFKEVDYKITADGSYAIGTCEFHGLSQQLSDDAQLFTFIK
jgi:ubiquinone/menaquinone biosynthesis C-methylase UbiE